MNVFVGRLHADTGCINGLVFVGRKKIHIVAAHPDVRVVSIDKREERAVSELPAPSVKSAGRTLRGIARRQGVTRGAARLLKVV
jgi:hypothetical protein